MALVFTFGYVLSRFRWSGFAPRAFRIGSNIVCFDHRFVPALRDVADESQNLQLILRNHGDLRDSELWTEAVEISRATASDGVLGAGDVPTLFGTALSHFVHTLRYLSGLPRAFAGFCENNTSEKHFALDRFFCYPKIFKYYRLRDC